MRTYQEIKLEDIAPCPLNPRKNFAGQKFDELVASVFQKGIIEPIIVRPIGEDSSQQYEIVAGERRFRAAAACELTAIPAIVRVLTDDEAYDFMLIENLQREDLTELEEAQSFKAYADRHGDTEGKALSIFSMKTGIRPAYIRARIAVLELPKDVLAMWKDGKLKYGHLEQLLRVADAGVRDQLVKRLKIKEGYQRIETVSELKHQIDSLQIPLGAARFPTKKECAGCRDNSTVQQDLFELGSTKAACSNPVCFIEKQRAWLTAHWSETPYHKAHKTNGFRFEDEVNYSHREDFHDWQGATKPAAACFKCEKFVTLIAPDGKVEEKQTCLDPSCYGKLKNSKQVDGSGKKESATAARPAWHGEYFRDKFYRPQIEAKIAELDPASPKGLALLAAAAAKAHGWYAVQESIGDVLGLKGRDNTGHDLVAEILKADKQKLEKVVRATISAIVMDGQNIEQGWNSDGFGTVNRAAVGRFLGVDLAKEYAVDEEYLKKKTIAELVDYVDKFGIYKIQTFSKVLKGKPHDKAKKGELVSAILAIGVDLVGKVPSEILKEGKKA